LKKQQVPGEKDPTALELPLLLFGGKIIGNNI